MLISFIISLPLLRSGFSRLLREPTERKPLENLSKDIEVGNELNPLREQEEGGRG